MISRTKGVVTDEFMDEVGLPYLEQSSVKDKAVRACVDVSKDFNDILKAFNYHDLPENEYNKEDLEFIKSLPTGTYIRLIFTLSLKHELHLQNDGSDNVDAFKLDKVCIPERRACELTHPQFRKSEYEKRREAEQEAMNRRREIDARKQDRLHQQQLRVQAKDPNNTTCYQCDHCKNSCTLDDNEKRANSYFGKCRSGRYFTCFNCVGNIGEDAFIAFHKLACKKC